MASNEVQRRVSGDHTAHSSTDQHLSIPAQEAVPGLVEMTQLQPQVAAQRNITDPTGLDSPSATQTSTSISDLPQQHVGEGTLATPSVEIPNETALSNSLDTPSDPKTIPPVTSPGEKSTPVISPPPDNSTPSPKELDPGNPSLLITLLLVSGARHSFRIDERFMTKRNVKVDGNNPVNMSVYTLKELIWREWRDDWEARPSSPSAIRIIFYGKMLDDKARLRGHTISTRLAASAPKANETLDCRFEIGSVPHVVHMTIKPQEIIDEEDAKIAKSGGRDQDGNRRSAGCRCVIL